MLVLCIHICRTANLAQVMVRGIEGSSLMSNHAHLLLKSREAGVYIFGITNISFGSE